MNRMLSPSRMRRSFFLAPVRTEEDTSAADFARTSSNPAHLHLQYAGARLLRSCNNEFANFDQVRRSFVRCSGFYTLESAVQWMRELDESKLWSQHWWPSLRPGRTKMCFLSALWHGVEEQRNQYVQIVVNLATLCALFMGGTMPAILQPPSVVLDPPEDYEWISKLYWWTLTVSYGCGLGVVSLATIVFNSGCQFIIRDADWLRAMDKCGDSVFMLSYVLFLISFLSICLAFMAVWVPTFGENWAEPIFSAGAVGAVMFSLGTSLALFLSFQADVGAYWFRNSGVSCSLSLSRSLCVRALARV